MRLLLKDLALDTDYELQARIKSDGTPSEWSPKFKFTTATDQIAPRAPTGVTLTTDDDSWNGSWTQVTENTDGSVAALKKYNMEIRSGTTVKKYSVSPGDDTTQEYGWTFAKIKQLFGANTTSLDFRVQAVNVAQLKSAWSEWASANMAAPAAPTNAVVESITDGLKISWTAPANMANVAGYHVYVSTTAGFTPSIDSRVYTGPSTSFTFSTSTYMTHYIVIRSYSSYGQESGNLTASGTPKSPFGTDTTPPSVPTLATPTLTRSGNVATANLSWTFDATVDPNKDISGFAIKWWNNADSTKFYIDNATKDSRSLSLTLPQPFADYSFQIASIDNVANYSAWSAAQTLTGSIAGAPPQVTGVTASTGMDSITLSWTASTALDVTSYKVELATNSGFTTGLYTTTTGGTNITISGLSANTTYWYRVSATDTTGLTGTASTAASIATKAFPTTSISDGNPPASSPAATATPGIGYIFVTWPAIANNDAVTYEVHISTSSAFTPTLGGTTKVAETAATNIVLEKDASGAQLAYGTTYYVRIIAKDRDTTSANAPAPGTVSAGVSPAKVQNSDSAIIVTATDIQTGTLSSSVITLGTGGIIKSSDYDATNKTGFSLTTGGLTIYNGSVAAETLISGTSITANLNVTGNMTIASSGTIKSSNYSTVAGSEAGFSLSSSGLDIRTGTVWANTLKGGTVTSANIILGSAGILTVDSTGAIQSNNWNATNKTGWKIDNTGATFYSLNATLSATNITGDTVTGRTLTINSGGSISSSNYNTTNQTGWSLGYNGLTIYNGTIQGAGVYTNSLTSLTNDSTTGQPLFSINAGGYAQLAGAKILGPTVLGTAASTTHRIQSYNYDSSTSTGWQIDAAGNANIHNLQIGTTTSGMKFTWGGSYSIFNLRGGTHKIYAYDDTYLNVSTNTLSIGTSGGVGGHFETAGDIFVGRNLYTDYIVANLNASVQLNSNINMNSNNINGINAITCSTINGGPTINGNPMWTAAGTGGTANVNWNNGKMQPVTSSRRYKENIRDLVVDLDSVYALVPRRYQRLNNPGTEVGFIAEEALDAGLNDWVMYNDDGEVESFDYFKYVVALQAAVVDLNLRLEDQEAKFNDLATRLDSAGL